APSSAPADQSSAGRQPVGPSDEAAARPPAADGSATSPPARVRSPRLSKDAYRRRSALVESDLSRLSLRKSQLELALGQPQVQANFVELRRVTSELADVEAALAQAEEAWLVLEEQAPR
ncbi:MAG TPA: hypothetical protein VFW92_08400, partial [Candidatus Limnocylindrales bacterium]|nr:hypothetical protein [Candidatus Limnocylindrales bacterium]